MRNHIALAVTFGLGGNAHDYQRSGWSVPEHGFAWSIGDRSDLSLPRPEAPFGCMLEVKCIPYVSDEAPKAQRLTVRVNGIEIASLRIHHVASFAWPLPAMVPGVRELLVTFEHPDATRPCDVSDSREVRRVAFMFFSVRLLALDEHTVMPPIVYSNIRFDNGVTSDERLSNAAAALTGAPVDRLAMSFEALCGNCELGFFQRSCGAEPLSLLRFAAGRPDLVLFGIDNGFDGIGDHQNINPTVSPHGDEWMISEMKYGLIYHTFTSPLTVTRDAMFAREAQRLKFLARKFMEDVAEGEKIFVCKDDLGIQAATAMTLVMALNRHGPCTVLWLTAADALHAPGRVEFQSPRLLRGWLDRLAPSDNPANFSLAGWLNVCVNALLLHRQLATHREGVGPP